MNSASISNDTQTEQHCFTSPLVQIYPLAGQSPAMIRHLVWCCIRPLSILICSLLVTHAAAAVTGAELARIRIPASADSGVATLRVRGDNTKRLILSASAFVDRSRKEVLPGIVAFEQATVDVKPGRTYDMKVTVSKIFFEGEAEVDVLNRGVKIGSLVVARAPFAVTVADAQALLRSGKKTAITLRNDARDPYDVR
jgi:P pilus assembly chaperone PapD